MPMPHVVHDLFNQLKSDEKFVFFSRKKLANKGLPERNCHIGENSKPENKGLPERNRHIGERIHVAGREVVNEMQVQLLHHRLRQRLAKLPQHHQHERCLYMPRYIK